MSTVGLTLALLLAQAPGGASASPPRHRNFLQRNLVTTPVRAAGASAPAVNPDIVFQASLITTGAAECDGTIPAPSVGGAITVTRASATTCTKSNGTVVALTNNQPRTNAAGTGVFPAGTNLVLHNRNLSQASWVKTNATCTLTATGTDAVSNTASACIAGAADATVLQTVTIGLSVRSTSLYLRRRTGVGPVYVTRNNGTTWIDVTAALSGSFVRLTPLTHSGLSSSLANPVVGVRLGTSGDGVDIDRVQDEAGAVSTPAIDTAGTGVNRSADVMTAPTPAGLLTSLGCARMDLTPAWTGNTAGSRQYLETSDTTRFFYSGGTENMMRAYNGTTQPIVAAGFVAGSTKRYKSTWSTAANELRVFNVTAGTSAAVAFSAFPAFGATLRLGNSTAGAWQATGTISNIVLGKSTGACE